jgi:hypothetical protein
MKRPQPACTTKNHPLRHRLISLSALLLAGSIAHHASAEIYWYWNTGARQVVNFGYGEQPPDVGGLEQGASPVSNAGDSFSAGPLASASSSLSVDYGILKARVAGAATGGTAVGGAAGSQVISRFTDTLTIDHPSLNGTAGVLSYSYYVPGSFSMVTGGQPGDQTHVAEGLVEFTVLPGGLSQTYAISYSSYRGASDTPTIPLIPVDGLIQVNRDFVFGTPFTIGAALSMRGLAAARYSPGSSSFDIDYDNSAYWNGVSGVSAGGSPVSGWTISSESGTAYLDSFAPNEVPEAHHAGATAAAGLLAYGLWRRHSRRA